MNQTMANVGQVSGNWKRWVLVWILAALGIWVASDFGLVGTLFGTAGLFFAFWGVRALLRAVSSRSVEETALGSLGGQSAAVQLVGDARPVDEPLVAPLTGTECVAYTVQVREYRPNRGGGD